MKKIVLFAAIAAAMGMSSCTPQAPKANMKSEIDSLSYMVGVTNAQGLKDFLVGRMGIDLKYMDDFYRGFQEAAQKSSPADKAYIAGLQIGQEIGNNAFEGISRQFFGNDSLQSLDKNNFLAGFIAGAEEKAGISMQEAQEYVQTHVQWLPFRRLRVSHGLQEFGKGGMA